MHLDLGFVFGSQDDIKEVATSSDWLTPDTILNTAYTRKATESFSYKLSAEVMGALRIDIDGDRIYASNYRSYYRNTSADFENPVFEEFTPTEGGNFSVSYSIINTAFNSSNGKEISEVFNTFLETRQQIAYRLAENNPNWSGAEVYDTLAGATFPKGYTSTSQEVLYYSFLTAYTGKSAASTNIKSPFYRFSDT